jgi:hypothetical protein
MQTTTSVGNMPVPECVSKLAQTEQADPEAEGLKDYQVTLR